MTSTRPLLRRLGQVLPGALGVALGAAVLPGGAVAPAAAEPVPDGARAITVRGQGYGHGHGMSQYGAQGAAQRGLGHRQILGHYYPGTREGRAAGLMRVLITGDPGRHVVVGNRSGLIAKVVGRATRFDLGKGRRAARQADRWRIAPLAGGRSALAYRNHGWHRYRTVRGTLEFQAGGAPITLIKGSGTRSYRGTLRSAMPSRGSQQRRTVNLVPLESYLRGVVPLEMPATWAPAAVRAQSVAARSYAAFERRYDAHGYFDVYDTTSDQVYGGRTAEHPASDRAVRATRHQVRTYRGAPAFTQFSSSNGGWMLAGSRPYLRSGRDAYDPVNRWRVRIPVSAFEARWPSAGKIRGVRVHTYPGAGPWVQRVVIRGARASFTVTGEEFRSWAGLRSASFAFAA
ncbi:SpoIID/LytB domain-containing protein [Nocardioides insulae]|uniref:SpoIID/LytB domain-containing protein n=1 Tax=Nocardioides insulae TaxID=394734 RepID=UPI000412F4DF|nr:SpoIID/LytB domain-containing protein [Nocardioides insulae]